MKKTIEKFYCDICGAEAEVQNINYPVLFKTDLTDGSLCKPYLSYQKIDMCRVCIERALVISGRGYMGTNHYSIKKTRLDEGDE